MCTYKTEHNIFKYMKFQFTTYIGVMYDETKAVAISDLQYRACQHANRQTVLQDKCTILTPCKSTTMCYITICQNDQAIKEQCSLVISHIQHTYTSIAVTSNLWIITSKPQAQESMMTIIYQDKASSTIHL